MAAGKGSRAPATLKWSCCWENGWWAGDCVSLLLRNRKEQLLNVFFATFYVMTVLKLFILLSLIVQSMKEKKKTQTNEDSCCSFMLVWQTQFLSQVTKYPAAQAWIMNDVDLISLTFSMKEFNLKTILKIWLRFSISMCLLQLSQWACIFLPLWPASSLLKKKPQTLSSGFWDSLYCKPREDHTLAEDYCGRWIQVDLACGNLPSIDDSQFSCSVPLLAQVTLTQLVTKSAVGTTILMLLKCCNC